MNTTHWNIQVDIHACGQISLTIFMPEVQKRNYIQSKLTTCFQLASTMARKASLFILNGEEIF